MFDPTHMIILVGVLLFMVFSGIHIAVSLGITSMLGIYLMTGEIDTVVSFTSNTAYEALRDYIFAVIPLFMLMGEFLAKCGAATDLFSLINRATSRDCVGQRHLCICHWRVDCGGCGFLQNCLPGNAPSWL